MNALCNETPKRGTPFLPPTDVLDMERTAPQATPPMAARSRSRGWHNPLASFPPRLVRERYEVGAKLGEGGMGMVYRGRDVDAEQEVAIKFLRPSLTNDDGCLRRFRREIRILSELGHPVFPRIFDHGTHGVTPYLVCEFVEGTDLETLLRRNGTLAPSIVAGIGAWVAVGLHAAHQAQIVHRDIKPSNIMLRPDGTVSVLDFGIARSFSANASMVSGTLVGTPRYMSPEQLRDDDPGPGTDIYALGVVMYELLAGRAPFNGSLARLTEAHLHHRAKPLRRLQPDVPVWLERIVMRCLEKKPEARFASMAELAHALQRGEVCERTYRPLYTGDVLVEDTTDEVEWTARLESDNPKLGWRRGTVVRFEGRYLRVAKLTPPGGSQPRWHYELTEVGLDDEVDPFVEYEESSQRPSVADRVRDLLRRI